MVIAFTICSNNYLAQAICLGHSLLEHNRAFKFKIGLVDKKNPSIRYELLPYEVIEVEKIGVETFDAMFKRYSVTELNTAVKPYFFRYFLENYKSITNFIYLDPDILVYNPFEELESELQKNEIIITPHITSPLNDDKSLSENDILNAGLYNLGFIALRRGYESGRLIDWWAARLETKAFVDFKNGMFTDQLWINFAPLFFRNVSVFTHPGYNMAYWNLHERVLNENNTVGINNKSFPLVFYHFSGFNPLKPEMISKYQDRFSFEGRKNLKNLFNDYSKKLFENNYSEFIKYSCHYLIEKQKLDLESYLNYKKTIPIYKRIARGVILRFIKLFKINTEYYTQ